MKPIWIVDDDQSIRWVLEKALARESLLSRSFTNVRDALAALEEDQPQVLISDIRMPGGSGLDLLQAIKARHPGLPVIVMTAYSDLDSAVAAFQGGAFEYLAKPFDVDKAVELIRRALEESLREEEMDDRLVDAPEILGQAPAMQDVFRAIGRLSQSNVTVMITGESGTGKELVARALHKHSPRANGPFIALNTAAIPKDLLESELFGHERGAFTGAQTMRRGRFEQAEGGTLFLDEIGDMPFDLQTRLLRVLSDGNFYRVGGHNPMRANVRVIAATHQNLELRVKEGLFREDLFHRLNVIRLRLPPLRERPEDITLLARHFLQKSAKELGVEPKRMSDEALAYVSTLPFPGNVRQLENLCNWLTVMAPAQTIEVKDLPREMLEAGTSEPVNAPRPERAPELRAAEYGGAQELADYGGFAVPVAEADTATAVRAAPAAAVVAAQAAQQAPAAAGWESLLAAEARAMLEAGQPEVMDLLTRRFEKAVLEAALGVTRGRRVEAATRLGIGRNTITRKLQELGFD
ncbi:nitrogen regulation protein NR(I) [Cupriavidus taiwanensis]|uniref:DNA-binding transcriptional regulator NtrC n=1 Tax=Cupriavidus taiwanensis TaxID=164546 RepID=A0A375GY14_9BURK|nr:nitrogen regulation protein NR(I) [Cupriavidus taiwanensis]SOY43286.1 Nitrogen regulation protein NR(I) [Cupriavidus taiwanensis]SOY45766.1 Nitrogen regulation protein NR(I) [Cupriavidus taiwanensis]SOY81211.1 Nitrogen regulation protein NR(I) [Cupriavidus taiwanensis]SOZ22062.1 Nitrogen regulation protein NR(I) [Cupriavidus taiwanensis]SOZ54045.1 Nitrogen regulation protein NR(I) [Cupriavidus taiwanensis]